MAWDQKQRLVVREVVRLVPVKKKIKLENYLLSVEHIVLGGRVKNFPVGYDVGNPVPILPYGVLAHLVVLRHHNRHHRDVDTTVVVSRAEAWSVKARKIAASIDRVIRK